METYYLHQPQPFGHSCKHSSKRKRCTLIVIPPQELLATNRIDQVSPCSSLCHQASLLYRHCVLKIGLPIGSTGSPAKPTHQGCSRRWSSQWTSSPSQLQTPSLPSAGGTRQSQSSTRRRSLGKDFIGKKFFAEC